METEKKILDYKNDLFFKYYCGKTGDENLDFRGFLIENITNPNTDHISIGNGDSIILVAPD